MFSKAVFLKFVKSHELFGKELIDNYQDEKCDQHDCKSCKKEDKMLRKCLKNEMNFLLETP